MCLLTTTPSILHNLRFLFSPLAIHLDVIQCLTLMLYFQIYATFELDIENFVEKSLGTRTTTNTTIKLYFRQIELIEFCIDYILIWLIVMLECVVFQFSHFHSFASSKYPTHWGEIQLFSKPKKINVEKSK